MLENPPNPLFKGELMIYALYMSFAHFAACEQSRLCSPLKRGLGGFSELTFEVGRLFNHEYLTPMPYGIHASQYIC